MEKFLKMEAVINCLNNWKNHLGLVARDGNRPEYQEFVLKDYGVSPVTIIVISKNNGDAVVLWDNGIAWQLQEPLESIEQLNKILKESFINQLPSGPTTVCNF